LKPLLKLCRAIDAVNDRIGATVLWLVLATTVISAANATVRKAFSYSSNAYLEIQWYLFAAVFLLAAGYTLLKDEHVRIDALSHRWSRRTQVWVDIVGLLVFVLPLCVWVIAISWPIVVRAYVTGEVSTNAGGLIRWPVYALIPAGFVLLFLQGLSELVKRIAFLRGAGPDPAAVARDRRYEEQLAEELREAARREHESKQRDEARRGGDR
jgi:TRAP-type mannitol/chloroaromatic compound transport system permease small subunit